ncbi:EAL domain-containing protein [Crenobacter luteus]|uniref:Diguanylate cyclase n=1 Tax=Crenobacter luteus TaxID=1452487 RepID=A0A165FQ52_9NEIS|nr:EAL domain-containing protein [Crenobacter luteus]KZE33874.1 diguanylate cyclase [Crenobacter luteus]
MSPLLQPIEQIASADILACTPDTPLNEAARRMAEQRRAAIVVLGDDGRALGIWTEADALRLDPGDTARLACPVSEWMSRSVLTLAADTSIHDATSLFRARGLRHALVERDGRYVGFVSLSDIVLNQGAESFLSVRRLDSLAVAPPLLLDGAVPVREALAVLRERRFDALVVCCADGGYGMFTLRDVLFLLAEPCAQEATLETLCSRPLLAVPGATSLLQARQLLAERQIRHLALRAPDGSICGVVGFADILAGIEQEFLLELHTALKERDAALLRSRQSLRLADKVFESTLEGILITDGDGTILSVNPAFTRITGYTADEAVGQTPALLKSGKQSPDFYRELWSTLKRDGQWQGEVVNRRKNGLLYTEHLSITAISDENDALGHYVAVFSDITRRKQAEERLHFLANHDALTGLPNRTLFLERLAEAIAAAQAGKERLALFFVDLDRFKLVNDTLGHAAGDELLARIGADLREAMPEGATVARLSGDEFTVLIPGIAGVEDAARHAQRVLEAVADETELAGEEVFVTASVGVSLYPDDGVAPETLLTHADTAMYRAKERGKNTFQFYTAELNVRAIERLKLEYALRRALAQDEFELWYQPKVSLATGAPVGAEALLRWRHPELGMVSPAQFIPIAEESALIGAIGEWVLATACRDTRRWVAEGLFAGRMAVNLSGRQLKLGGLVDTVRAALADSGLESDYLELEVTESVAMDDADGGQVGMLDELRALGVQLSIDDFGTGYSSLAYLKRLPVQVLKIDRSFIADLSHDKDDAAITTAIVSIAKSLGLAVVAEGVEEVAQRDFLAALGCDAAQGYLFGKPMPAAHFEAYLAAQRR